MAPPHHLNYFDFESLSSLVTRLGFEVRERSTSFPMELFLLMGLDYTKDSDLGRACHNQRKRFDLSLEHAGFKETRRAFYRALAAAGLGTRSRRDRGEKMSATPFFIVSSGRSGTAMMVKALAAAESVTIEHEYHGASGSAAGRAPVSGTGGRA